MALIEQPSQLILDEENHFLCIERYGTEERHGGPRRPIFAVKEAHAEIVLVQQHVDDAQRMLNDIDAVPGRRIQFHVD